MRIASVLCAGLAVVAGNAVAQPSRPAATGAVLGFDGAKLGMSLAAWRALSPPAGVDPTARPFCSGDQALSAAGPGALGAPAAPNGQRVCAYASVYGHSVLVSAIPYAGRFSATDARYIFARGRLVEIDLKASGDAFNDVDARLTGRYGPAIALERDRTKMSGETLAQVRKLWRAGGGTVTLTDPADPAAELEVRIALDNLGPRQAAAGATRAPG